MYRSTTSSFNVETVVTTAFEVVNGRAKMADVVPRFLMTHTEPSPDIEAELTGIRVWPKACLSQIRRL